jgi:hypothetical protein
MSHSEFVPSYQNGRVGCSVSAFLTLGLFSTGKIHDKRVSINLLLWSLGILILIGASLIGFLNLPVLWALLCTIAMLAIYTLAFFYWVGGFVVSAALANEEFYELAKAKRVLWIYSDDEENLPKLQKVALMRRARPRPSSSKNPDVSQSK